MSFFRETLSDNNFWKETFIALGASIAIFLFMLVLCGLAILWPPLLLIAMFTGVVLLLVWDERKNTPNV